MMGIIFVVLFIIIFLLGSIAGYGIAICNIYDWMYDILEPIPATLENKDFLLGVMFAQKELEKRIKHTKED